MTAGNDEYLLAQSPQEWKWLLQDEGLIADEQPVTAEDGKNGNIDDLSAATKPTDDDFTTIDDATNIGDALDWLQRTCAQDLKSRDLQCERARKKYSSTQNRIASLERCLRQDKQQLKNLPEEVGNMKNPNKAMLIETISKCMSEVIQPQCLQHIQDGWKKYVGAMKPIVQQYQRILMAMNIPNRTSNLQALQQVLENESCIDSLKTYQSLCINLKEMQSLFQTRHRLIVKKSIPSFLTAVATMKDDDKLLDHTTTLQKLLEDITPPINLLVWWCLWQSDSSRNEWIAQSLQVRSRIQGSTAALQELQNNEQDGVKELEELKASACRSQMMRVKKELEVKITALFDFEDLIEISIP